MKNQIVESNLRLVVSIAKNRVRTGYDLSERVSDGNFALMQAVDRFDFARGNKFSTYASWAILNELARYERRQKRRGNRPFVLYQRRLSTDRHRERRTRARSGPGPKADGGRAVS